MRQFSRGRPAGEALGLVAARLIGVVDDDESVREAFSSLLRSAEYRCACFPCALSFLESPFFDKTDRLLLDFHMPGMDDLEPQTQLRERNLSIPIVFITAYDDNGLHEKVLRAGAPAFFGELFDDESVLEAIHLERMNPIE